MVGPLGEGLNLRRGARRPSVSGLLRVGLGCETALLLQAARDGQVQQLIKGYLEQIGSWPMDRCHSATQKERKQIGKCALMANTLHWRLLPSR